MLNFFKKIEPLYFLITLVVSIGLVTLFSIAKGQGDYNPWNQLVFIGFGVLMMILVSKLSYLTWRRYALLLFCISIVLLFIVLFLSPIQGSSRWINLGLFQLQPSEVAKLSLIVLLGYFLSKEHKVSLWKFILSIIYVAVPGLLILIQPDLGTSLVFAAIWLVVISMANVKKQYIAVLLLIGVLALPIGFGFLKDYQKHRVTTFLKPSSDPQGIGYNVNQATIAIGNGGWSGAGADDSTQSQLNFLPSSETDFIFAVISEKFGFFGASLVLVCLMLIVIRAVLIGWRSADKFGLLLSVGIAAVFAAHTIINIGMNLRLMPVTGLPLPFVSYGGTHIMVEFVMAGLLISVSKHNSNLSFASNFNVENLEISNDL